MTARDAIVSCERCPRLREHCARVAVEKKRAHASDTYWGRPVPGFGDPRARVLVLGLAPAAHGANRTGRVFTGDGSGDFRLSEVRSSWFVVRGRWSAQGT
jgi:uracil-DNA glycosylase